MVRVKTLVMDVAWGGLIVAALTACGFVFAASLALRQLEHWLLSENPRYNRG